MMTKFYTAKGDDGFTGLLGAGRVPKNNRQIEAIGALDEANACLGMVRAICRPEAEKNTVLLIQRDLFHLMSEVASTPEKVQQFRKIDAERVRWLEEAIDRLSAQVDAPKEFIVPGDTFSAAVIDHARTVVRRAERRLADLYFAGELENSQILRYINRLSSYCFVLEIFQSKQEGIEKISLAKEGKSV